MDSEHQWTLYSEERNHCVIGNMWSLQLGSFMSFIRLCIDKCRGKSLLALPAPRTPLHADFFKKKKKPDIAAIIVYSTYTTVQYSTYTCNMKRAHERSNLQPRHFAFPFMISLLYSRPAVKLLTSELRTVMISPSLSTLFIKLLS